MQSPLTSARYLAAAALRNKLTPLKAIPMCEDPAKCRLTPNIRSTALAELRELSAPKEKWNADADSIAFHIRLLEQFLNARVSRKRGVNQTDRDRYMASNVKWITEKEGPGVKMMVWAHNDHVSRLRKIGRPRPMGSYLENDFREKFLSLGFAFDQGNFRAFLPLVIASLQRSM